MKNPATSKDVIAFCDHMIKGYQETVKDHEAYLARAKMAHERTIWFRWFKQEYQVNIWDVGCMRASTRRAWIRELARLRVKAEYGIANGFEPVDIPEDWANLFYDWIAQ